MTSTVSCVASSLMTAYEHDVDEGQHRQGADEDLVAGVAQLGPGCCFAGRWQPRPASPPRSTSSPPCSVLSAPRMTTCRSRSPHLVPRVIPVSESTPPVAGLARGPVLFGGEDGRGRSRRPVDGLLLLFAVGVFTSAALVSDRTQSQEQTLVSAAATLLGWLDPFWRAAYAVLIAVALLVVGACLATHRWRVCRDMAIALAATYLIGYPVGRSVRSDWPSLTEKLWATLGQYPALRLAGAVAVLVVAAPELTRTARVFVGLAGRARQRRLGRDRCGLPVQRARRPRPRPRDGGCRSPGLRLVRRLPGEGRAWLPACRSWVSTLPIS